MKKVVITGLGMVTPVGNGKTATWSALKAGKCGIGRITKFDASRCICQVAGELKDFDAYLAETGYVDKKAARHMDPFSIYAVAAAVEAWKDAGFKVQSSRSVELRTNFRSNPAISRVAKCVASRISDRDDLIDISVNEQEKPQTSLPEILICPDPETEMQILVHLIRSIIKEHGSSSIAVLYKLKSMKIGYISTLKNANIPYIDLNAMQETPISISDSVYVSTMHSAKGLEFDHVILADVSESIFRSFDVSDSEIGNKNRRLLYTAMTRARQSLHILTPDRDYALILNDIEPDLADIRSISL